MPLRVLVVEYDEDERRRISGILEEEGLDVLGCLGPTAPDYSCLGGRGKSCPLADDADVVVLDMRLASDEMMVGTAGWELLVFYLSSNKPVVALSGQEDSVRPRADAGVEVLKRHPRRDELLEAIGVLLATSRA